MPSWEDNIFCCIFSGGGGVCVNTHFFQLTARSDLIFGEMFFIFKVTWNWNLALMLLVH